MIAICINDDMPDGIAMKLNLNEKYNVFIYNMHLALSIANEKHHFYYVHALDGTFCGVHWQDKFIPLAEWREQQINNILNETNLY